MSDMAGLSSKTWVAHLARAFPKGEGQLSAQLVRVSVLYEDLKLEFEGASAGHINSSGPSEPSAAKANERPGGRERKRLGVGLAREAEGRSGTDHDSSRLAIPRDARLAEAPGSRTQPPRLAGGDRF